MAAGRPPIYSSAEDMILAIETYFEEAGGEQDKDGNWLKKPYHITITGLAIALGFESRQSIYDYAEKGEFSYIIKAARLRVENSYEQNLYGTTPTGSIFALKNMGWKDKTETELTGKDGGPIQVTGMQIL